jgi:hypothetical protein
MHNTKFEQYVLDIVRLVNKFDSAHFFSGTLFIQCSEDDARAIFHKLTAWLGLGSVRVSKVGKEYAFDLV